MKTINTIQILAKFGKILSKINYIFCFIGAIGCGVGIASLPFADTGIFKLGGVTIHSFIINNAGVELNTLYPILSGMLITCIGHAITAKFAEKYFNNELNVGTPFTVTGANELLRLGIITICVPLGTLVLSQIVSGIIAGFSGCENKFNIDGGDCVVLGAMFIVISVLCRYGAEIGEQTK